jgi:hypothetical protein
MIVVDSSAVIALGQPGKLAVMLMLVRQHHVCSALYKACDCIGDLDACAAFLACTAHSTSSAGNVSAQQWQSA